MQVRRGVTSPLLLLALARGWTVAALVLQGDSDPVQDGRRMAVATASADEAEDGTGPWHWLTNRSINETGYGIKKNPHHASIKAMVAVPPGPDGQKHMVQHIALLNDIRFWCLMAVVIICIAVAVIKMELQLKGEDAVEAESRPTQQHQQQGQQNALAPAAGDAAAEPAQDGVHSLRWVANLFFCVIGLNIAMLFWGVAQEFMMTSTYIGQDGIEERIPSALCLVMFNRMLTVAVTALIIALSPRYSFDFPGRSACGVPAMSNLVASWCQYQSLAYVSFPIQTAAKSAKLLPVVILNSLRGKQQSVLDYAEAILIVFALVMFGLETEGDVNGMHARGFGVLLLCGLIFFDSMTPHLQDRLFKKNPELSMIQATFAMGCVSTLVSLVTLVVSGNGLTSLIFFLNHGEAALHALVLSLCSTLTQFLISYTIKNFGPVTFALIATTRQLISVCLSSVLFMHHITLLAWCAAVVVFGTVIGRAVRPREYDDGDLVDSSINPVPSSSRSQSFVQALALRSKNYKLVVCTLGIHLPLMFYSVAQEFMFTHTFHGQIFKYPLVLIVFNRIGASLLAVVVLKLQGIKILDSGMWLTVAPAAANLVATFCQYQALLFLRFPVQTLLKSAKVVPVMLCGRLMKNRTYSWLDYAEGVLITGLVCVFTWSFSSEKENMLQGGSLLPGLLLMGGYLLADSITSNAEDAIYQRVQLDPGQLLLGMQASAGLVGAVGLLSSGQLLPAMHFLFANKRAVFHLLVLLLAEAGGAYACTVTVRLFGPAVFTLLLMSHQIVSLMVSVALFGHKFDWLSCLCLGVVTLVILTSSLRRVMAERLKTDQTNALLVK